MDKFVTVTRPQVRDPTATPSTSAEAAAPAAPGPGAEDKRKREKSRKYSEMYLKFGFTFKENEGVELPVCVVCAATLSNESMKPSKLQRHLEKNHGHLQDKPLDYFQARLHSLQGQQTMMRKSAKVGELALKASYQVALRVAQCKKPYTIAEDLILPAATDMCKTMFGNDGYAKKLKTIPLSDTTIALRIGEMASDVRMQFIEKLQTAEAFALQLDESVDMSKDEQLLAFVRFVDQDEMCEEFLFCKKLPERTTSADIFKVIDDFFCEKDISWAKCVAVCTDGARAMTGQKSGLMALVKKVAPKLCGIIACYTGNPSPPKK